MTDTKRDAFEAWARTKNLWLTATPEGRYLNSYTCGAWDGWEAASVSGGEAAVWISVDERLPNLNQVVVISGWSRCRGEVTNVRFKVIAVHMDGKFFNDETGDDFYAPTHWMAIPDPDAHPAPSAPAQDALASEAAVPEGWKLVPVEPTDEMIHAVMLPGPGYRFKRPGLETSYRLMVAAAPQPAQPTQPAETIDEENERIQDYADQNMLTFEEAMDELRAGPASIYAEQTATKPTQTATLSDEQRIAIQECIDYLKPAAAAFSDLRMGDSKHARCIRTLRALLARCSRSLSDEHG